MDAIAGVATGGIASALVAQELGLPFIYVRSKAKAHGLGNAIEGDLSVLSNVVVIEDLISTGQSSLKAVDALREAGVEVKGLIAIFTYGFLWHKRRLKRLRASGSPSPITRPCWTKRWWKATSTMISARCSTPGTAIRWPGATPSNRNNRSHAH